MTWFDSLIGFPERTGDEVRSNIQVAGENLVSTVNNRSMHAGEFSTPTLDDLRNHGAMTSAAPPIIELSSIIADVQSLHQNPESANAVFQVASQFNCLEMASPHAIPEDGVGIYQNDRTQGPVCSICAGAGTIFRNYFANVNGQIGQSADNQIDCLSQVGVHLENGSGDLWRMQNGYCFPSLAGLQVIEAKLAAYDALELDQVRGKLKVGLQRDTEVTLGNFNHHVTQVFCSALPIAYSDIPPNHWNHFPRLILEATYEATFHVALQNLRDTGCKKLFLTLVGGGVFGNPIEWILAAIGRSLEIFASSELSVFIVSYGSSHDQVEQFIADQQRPRSRLRCDE